MHETPGFAVKGHRLADGGIRLLLGPLIDPSTGLAERQLQAADVTIRIESSPPIDAFAFGPVNPAEPAALDIVILIDTSSSMGWAIDALKSELEPFVSSVRAAGFDPLVGGIEFGDEVRTQSPLGNTTSFQNWLDTLTPLGGGDPPSSGLDALYAAVTSFAFRSAAARYIILASRSGLHELRDGTSCANFEFFAAAGAARGSFVAVLFPEGRLAGIHPARLAADAGGVAVEFSNNERTLLGQRVLAEVMSAMYVISVPASAVPPNAFSLSVRFPLSGQERYAGVTLPP